MTGHGLFVVFEGGEGSGKSTVSSAVAAELTGRGHTVVLTREPGGTPAGEKVRELLREPLAPWAEAFAFLAARAQIVQDVIRPALDDGAIVLCDRFEASTFAYQGYGRGLPIDQLRDANEAATGGLHPDLTLFLDIEPEVGLRRKAGEVADVAIGNEDLAFHKRVRDGYLAQARAAPTGHWVTVDATLELEMVCSRAVAAVRERRPIETR